MRLMMPIVLLTAALTVPAMAADAPRQSWGKAGVSLDTYLADARACASQGWNADIEGTEAVRVFRDGTGRIEALIGTTGTGDATDASGQPDPATLARHAQIAQVVEGTRPRERYAEVRAVQIGTVDRCLADRGYVRFQLTGEQRRRVGKLGRDSDARRAYLHALASDGAVLAAQPVVAVSPR